MRKIIISAGHGGSDPGASANGYIERDLAIELRSLLVKELKSRGIDPLVDPDKNKLLETLTWLRGKFGNKDILLDLHWNSGGGTGIEVIIPDGASQFEKTLAQALADKISEITTWKKRGGGVKPESDTARKKLGWMRPNAENILIEMCFIDNKLDMSIYNANKQAIVKSIVNVLSQFAKN